MVDVNNLDPAQMAAQLRVKQGMGYDYKAPQGGMAGRVYVGANPMQHIAEVLRGVQAGQDVYEGTNQLKDIQKQRQEALVSGLRDFNDTYSGKAAVAPQRTEAAIPAFDEADAEAQQANVGGYSGMTGGQAAVKGNPMSAISGLAASSNPMLSQYGVKMLADYPQQQAEAAAKAATIARQEAADKERERHNRVTEENMARAIAGRGTEKLKTLPPTVNNAFLGNDQSLNTLNNTIDMLEKNPNATGFKGYLPNAILNRVDPEGTSARAGVADIGSLKIHDRSGAAVSASESPRLMPFIPLATDDNATVLKKLKRFRDEVAREQSGLSEIYSQDQGYRPNPIANRTPKPSANPAPSGGMPSPDAIAAEIARRGGK